MFDIIWYSKNEFEETKIHLNMTIDFYFANVCNTAITNYDFLFFFTQLPTNIQ